MILQKREKIILQICIATIVLVGEYVSILEPVYKRWSDVSDELRAKQILLEKSNDLISHRDELKKEFAKIKTQVGSRASLEEYSGRFLLQMEQLGHQAGVAQITSINPLPIKEEKDYYLLQSQINFDTAIGGLTRFLYDLSSEKYFISVERLQIDGNLEDPSLLKCQMVVSTIYINPLERDR